LLDSPDQGHGCASDHRERFDHLVVELAERRKPTWSGQDEHCTLSAGGSSRRRRGFSGQMSNDPTMMLVGTMHMFGFHLSGIRYAVYLVRRVELLSLPTAGSVVKRNNEGSLLTSCDHRERGSHNDYGYDK